MARIIFAEEFKKYKGWDQFAEWMQRTINLLGLDKDWTLEFQPLPPGEMYRRSRTDKAAKVATIWVRPGNLDWTTDSWLAQMCKTVDHLLPQFLAQEKEK